MFPRFLLYLFIVWPRSLWHTKYVSYLWVMPETPSLCLLIYASEMSWVFCLFLFFGGVFCLWDSVWLFSPAWPVTQQRRFSCLSLLSTGIKVSATSLACVLFSHCCTHILSWATSLNSLNSSKNLSLNTSGYSLYISSVSLFKEVNQTPFVG